MAAKLDRMLAQKRRDVFLPLSFRFSAKLEQMDWEEMTEDPVYTTFALRNGQKIFRADGLINWFDTCLEAEAAGVGVERDEMGIVTGLTSSLDSLPDSDAFLQQGEIPLALDIARRLCEEVLDECAVLGYLTGLHTLLGRIFEQDKRQILLKSVVFGEGTKEERDALNAVVQLSVRLTRAYCEAGVGGLFLAEEDKVENFGYLRTLEPVFNVANYYSVPLILLSKHPLSNQQAKEALQYGFRYVSSPAGEGENSVEIVHTIPTDLMMEEEVSEADWLQKQQSAAGEAGIYISEWELPLETAPEKLIEMGRLLHG